MKSPSSPITDLTTFNAVESIFRKGARDPWARQTAGELVDYLVYARKPRFILPIPQTDIDPEDVARPRILAAIQEAVPGLIQPEVYSTSDRVELAQEHLRSSFQRFSAWSHANRQTLQRWSRLHREEWIKSGHQARVAQSYVYAVNALRPEDLGRLANAVGVSEEDVCYAFDVVLRYPLYGELAGAEEHYLNHPLRDVFRIPTAELSPGPRPAVPVSFKASTMYWAPRLSLEGFVRVLVELRDAVWSAGLHEVGPREFEIEVIREVVGKVGIPPTLRSSGKWLGVAGGVIAGLGAIPALGPGAAVLGGLVAVSSAIWTGRLPPAVAKAQWLRWAVEWSELEKQAEPRE